MRSLTIPFPGRGEMGSHDEGFQRSLPIWRREGACRFPGMDTSAAHCPTGSHFDSSQQAVLMSLAGCMDVVNLAPIHPPPLPFPLLSLSLCLCE